MAKSRFSTVNFGTANTGLVGTVGYTLYSTNGTVFQARKTTGIVEFTNSGVYGSQVNLPLENNIMVLWDTGGGSPVYGSEENNIQLDEIQNETDNIRAIWNSIKNQGSFFSAVMEKLGLLEKNKGLTKPDIKEVVDGIKFPEFPKATDFPSPPDYLNDIRGLRNSVDDLSSSFKSKKQDSVDVKKIEQLLLSITARIENLPKYDSNFSSMQSFIKDSVSRVESSIKSENSNVSSEIKSRNQLLMNELLKLQQVFSRFDSLMTKITAFNEKLNQLDANDKSLKASKDSIQAEIQRLNILVNTLGLIERNSKPSELDNSILRSFGGKR